jgi:hypothetical protein
MFETGILKRTSREPKIPVGKCSVNCIAGYHSGEYKKHDLQGCNAV